MAISTSDVSYFSMDFYHVNGRLTVEMETEDLYLRSIVADDLGDYVKLYGDLKVMENFATDSPFPLEKTSALVNMWVQRWQEGNPFSAIAVFDKKRTFLGNVAVEGSSKSGVAVFTGLGYEAYWRRGFGTQAAEAVIIHYVPLLVAEGHLIQGQPLEKIEAAARPENVVSHKILKKLGFRAVKQEEQDGALRNVFEISMTALGPQPDPPRALASRWCSIL